MPLVNLIGQGISRVGARVAPLVFGVVKSDKLILNYAWKGYRHKGRIVQGLRGSLVTGSVIGGIVNNDDELDTGSGSIPKFNGSKTGKPYKTRSRFRRRNNGRYHKCYRPNNNHRRSRSF